MVKRISEGTMCLGRYIIPIIITTILIAILFMCESHFKCSCIVNAEKLIREQIQFLYFQSQYSVY